MNTAATHTPQEILKFMLEHDRFTAWLGIEVTAIAAGSCTLHFTVREEMLNGLGTLHGGVTYAAADSALAFASNSHGRLSVALNCAMDYMVAGKAGDVLTCTATEESLQNKVAVYLIRVTNQRDEVMAIFKGTVYRTGKPVVREV